MCDDTPSAPTLHQLLQTISLLGQWLTSGSDRGIAHFFTATSNTIKGVGGKRTNEQHEPGVNWKCKTRSCETLYIPVSIYRLTLAWIFSETSTKLLGMPPYPDQSSSVLWTLSHANLSLCCPVSTALSVVRRHLPSSQSLCLTLWLAFASYFRSRGDLEFKPFIWFRAKTDKGIVCLANHLHSVTYARTYCTVLYYTIVD